MGSITPEELLELIQKGDAERIPSSLEKAIDGLRQELIESQRRRDQEVEQFKSLLIDTLSNLPKSQTIDTGKLIDQLSNLMTLMLAGEKKEKSAYRFEVTRDNEGFISNIFAEPTSVN